MLSATLSRPLQIRLTAEKATAMTDAGWPRPIVGGWPIPWVSPADNLSTMDSEREAICSAGKICAVCGEANGATAYILIRAKNQPADLSSVRAQAMDNGVLHRKCLMLALKHCPELLRLQKRGLLQIVKCKTAEIRARATLDGAKCEIIILSRLQGGTGE